MATVNIKLSSAAGTVSQIVCVETAITPITYATSGATGVQVSGLTTGLSSRFALPTLTISGTPTTIAGVARYKLILTGTTGGTGHTTGATVARGYVNVVSNPQILTHKDSLSTTEIQAVSEEDYRNWQRTGYYWLADTVLREHDG